MSYQLEILAGAVKKLVEQGKLLKDDLNRAIDERAKELIEENTKEVYRQL